MSQPISRLRILLLAILLFVEIALTISLRNWGWVATGQAMRSSLLGIAVVLPFLMTTVLLYRARDSLRHGQFSLRTLLAITLVAASFLALLPLLVKPKQLNTGPSPVSQSAQFEVFQLASTGAAGAISLIDPETGETLLVANQPVITATDILTVQLRTQQQGHAFTSLCIDLSPAGGNKLLKVTTASKGSRLVVVIDGTVLTAPKIVTPISEQFQLTGGSVETRGVEVFETLTK